MFVRVAVFVSVRGGAHASVVCLAFLISSKYIMIRGVYPPPGSGPLRDARTHGHARNTHTHTHTHARTHAHACMMHACMHAWAHA